ncbi:glycosyltransferase family 32 protein [Pseudomonas viridiflava]|uniref:glycosyltransferase family 32 protein n=1 Tax=Pseudomonas viridiflava TaxID=33069 RepID=UPI000F02D66A|nr:glycosyltransferase [Pseudomonas viridiflava]MEE4224495.1 glycosyltransferase [Pseudomonas viridiflava]
MDSYPLGFEEDDRLRSAFIRNLTLHQLNRSATSNVTGSNLASSIPRTLVQYWHDPHDVPEDVQACIDSWKRLSAEGFAFRMFNDVSAAEYITEWYGKSEQEAFARCRHPAMRCDYLRMCVLVAEGGLYVDADDVLLGDNWRYLFHDSALKVQPLCYDIPSCGMVPASEIWRSDLPTDERIFYVNNDPIAAPAHHPVLKRALSRSTEKLLGKSRFPEIQETTGPGNITASLAAHARDLMIRGAPFDFELLNDWESIAQTRWDLSYRNDARNWRNMDSH